MLHKTTIKNYPGTFAELATEVGDLRYDALAEYLEHLSRKIEADGDTNTVHGRRKLARELHDAATKIHQAREAIDRAWVICAPYL
jgi:hypothetical protein